MALLIQNGEIVTADSRYFADIFVEDETITRIGSNLELPPGTEVVDARGCLICPGFINPHVHIYLPFMATFAKDTHETASIAALMGGTTTFIEMCCPSRLDHALDSYYLWKEKAHNHSACDYAFHMGVTRWNDETESQLRRIVADGTSSFKVFLAYKNFFGIEDTELFQTLRLGKEMGVITAAHCENAEIVSRLQTYLLSVGKTGPEWHEPSRPETVEAAGTHRFAAFVELTKAQGYVVHLSCAPALEEAARAKQRGVRLAIESVLPHFLLDNSLTEQPGVEAMKYVMSPPLRDRRNHRSLWNGLRSGIIDTVGTDHCPFDLAQKGLGELAFTDIPNGIPGIEERVSLMYTRGVVTGQIDIHRFVDALSTRAAKLFGLFPRKGTIAPGSDADLVVFDPTYRGIISVKTQHTQNDYNAFEEFGVKGRASVVTVRGKVQVRDGVFVGDRFRGRFLAREPIGDTHGE